MAERELPWMALLRFLWAQHNLRRGDAKIEPEDQNQKT